MIEQLIDLGVEPNQARRFDEPLRAAMALHDITGPQRVAAFLAHVMVESSNLTALEENLRYTTAARICRVWPSRFPTVESAEPFVRNPKALANRVYANRNGNGDEASGDGWTFRGRGLFQLTGRENYRRASAGLGLGAVYLMRPELVAEPSDAALTAAWYWVANGCNQMADAGQFDATTKAINGPAMLHSALRQSLFNDALQVFA